MGGASGKGFGMCKGSSKVNCNPMFEFKCWTSPHVPAALLTTSLSLHAELSTLLTASEIQVESRQGKAGTNTGTSQGSAIHSKIEAQQNWRR
eukprot:4698892-Amphidinium_carterae.1